METNIPSKLVIKMKNWRPWINTAARHALRRKQRLYRNAKRSGSDEDKKKKNTKIYFQMTAPCKRLFSAML